MALGAAVRGPWPAARPRLPDQIHHAATRLSVRHSDSTVHRGIDRPAGPLVVLLGAPPSDSRELWIIDDTLIPVHHQHKTAKSKNYRQSVNVQVVCRARDRRIVAVVTHGPGERNDNVVFRETVGRTLPDHPRLPGDDGHHGTTGPWWRPRAARKARRRPPFDTLRAAARASTSRNASRPVRRWMPIVSTSVLCRLRYGREAGCLGRQQLATHGVNQTLTGLSVVHLGAKPLTWAATGSHRDQRQ
ncbi:transposase [Streptomyces sp. NPDC002547]